MEETKRATLPQVSGSPTSTEVKARERPNLVALARATWVAAQGIIEAEDVDSPAIWDIQYKWAYTLYADARRLGLSATDIISDADAFFNNGDDIQYPEEEPLSEELGDEELPF